MGITLKRPEVAAKYEATFDIDQHVTLLGLYKGPLSNITLTAANHLRRQKSNLLKEKEPLFKTRENTAPPEPQEPEPVPE